MNIEMLKKLAAALAADNETDAMLALRGVKSMCKEAGVALDTLLVYAAEHMNDIRKSTMTFDQVAATAVAAPQPITISGMPQCRVPSSGAIEIIVPGKTSGDVVVLPGASANAAEIISSNLKDVLVAAAINKSRFKLKLLDIKNGRGETLETALQAEYEREGMASIRVWVNVRGEVAALATVLRKAVANSFPELVAA